MASSVCATVGIHILALVLFMHYASALQSVPAFTLELDLAPETRWNGAVKQIVDLHGWENSFGPVLDLYIPLFLLFPANVSTQIAAFLQTNNPDLHGELTGIGQQLADYGCTVCNSTLIYAFAYFYELSHTTNLQAKLPPTMRRSCTGILTLPTDPTRDILHGRNMDEDPHTGRNITLHITVNRMGKYQYSMVDWTWLTGGIATTSRRNGVTMEMNWNNDLPALTLNEIMGRILDPKTIPVLQLFRQVNDASLNFESTVSKIMSSQFASPFYNIISGTQRRGAVLTIEFNKTNNVAQFLNDSCLIPYMVQTNYDRWLPDPPSDPRRTVAQDTLAMLGSNRSGSELGLWMTLSVYPVHNPGTMFTALMSVAKDPEVYIRTAMEPKDF